MRSFDIAFLRSFAAVADAGTLRSAGEQRARSTAAISQQMRTLEAVAGVSLFDRSNGKISLSSHGRTLLPFARELIRLNDEAMHALQHPGADTVRFGMPQDFALSALPDALSAFMHDYPLVKVEAEVERNSRIAALLSEGALDVALLIGRAGTPGGKAITPMPSVWLAQQGAQFSADAPLPLLLVEEPCLFREFALEALASARIPYRVAFTSPSVSGLWGAVRAGLGVTARMPIGLPEGIAPWDGLDLPPLPCVKLALHRREHATPAAGALFAIVAQALETARKSCQS
jgi:DNA-binding transcriptional LysR family regulator